MASLPDVCAAISVALPAPCIPSAAELGRLAAALGAHYLACHRALPWRAKRDPWAIWVSEVMLQQTQVDTVVPRYAAFLAQFPTPDAMAAATEAEVCHAWAGLGYYRRARLLHAGAQAVVAEHGGRVPTDLSALLALPGVGRYTAGAIASIAFGQRAPLVDGNVVRVFSRLFARPETLHSGAGRKIYWALAEAFIAHAAAPGGRGGGHPAAVLNQALMELGATVCTPRQPACASCPVQKTCRAYSAGAQALLPPPVVRPTRRALRVAYAYCRDAEGLWLWQRPLRGLWAGLHELPSAEGDEGEAALAAMGLQLGAPMATVQHILTHRTVTATVYAAQATAQALRAAGCAPVHDIARAPLSTLARRAIVAAELRVV